MNLERKEAVVNENITLTSTIYMDSSKLLEKKVKNYKYY